MSELPLLNESEQRVLGVLIEKSLATPQYYPLTLNQVVTACNQKSNRDPLLSMMEDEVEGVLTTLANRGLATQVFASGSRTGKYRQELTSMLEMDGQSMAVLAEFLLRGAQTLGELRSRASRMKAIPDMNALKEVLDGMAQRNPPLARRLTPPGIQRGVRWGHLLQEAGNLELEVVPEQENVAAVVKPSSPVQMNRNTEARLEQLEQKIANLEDRLQVLEERQ
ncbi:MAG: hypothetical protein CBC13_07885 [Planctomycetia bacterium TMED53]|nr:MAG: hypothetical protein CBC13_07885 [Planctomycetia bacterium TMED53]